MGTPNISFLGVSNVTHVLFHIPFPGNGFRQSRTGRRRHFLNQDIVSAGSENFCAHFQSHLCQEPVLQTHKGHLLICQKPAGCRLVNKVAGDIVTGIAVNIAVDAGEIVGGDLCFHRSWLVCLV